MKLLCLDSNSILNRAFYGIKLLSTKEGVYTNAVFGYMNIFKKLCDEVQPDAVACAFDLKEPTFRHKMYDGYKAQRKGMPEELAMQLPLVKELLGHLGYRIVTLPGFEADDILGSFARLCREQGHQCVIATGDRDSLQLISEATTVLLASTKQGKPSTTVCDVQYVRDTYGVEPRQLIDVKALMGDASDNIPGVKGIGEKSALKLIAENGSLDSLYERLPALKLTPSVREKLTAGEESARMSRTLAEICCTAPLPVSVEDCVPAAPDYAAARALLGRLQMFSLIDRLEIPETGGRFTAQEEAPCAPAEMLPVREGTAADLQKALTEGPLDLVCRFEGDRLTGFSVPVAEGVLVFDAAKSDLQALLRAVLESETPKRVCGLKQLWRWALTEGVRARALRFDVELAGYLLSPNANEYSIARLAAEYETPTLPVDLPEEGEPFAALAADCARMSPLCSRLEEEIGKNGLRRVLEEIELPLARVLASMELIGFEVTPEGIADFGKGLDSQIFRLEEDIYALAGEPFNINSPKQLGEILFERLHLPVRRRNKSGYSTDAKVLESLFELHPIVPAILEYRQLAKLKSTYIEGLLKAIGPDGRIHSSFRQTETRTGRISSTEPNMQNIPVRTPLGSTMRRFFVAREGCLLVDADYSQIELRVLAHMARDENMLRAFRTGEDIHTQTAAQVFGMPAEMVTPEMRSRAKAVNFGIVYGIGAFSLSKNTGVSVAEADAYIKSYLRTYSGIARYMEETVEAAKKDGFVATMLGRRRYLPELQSANKNIQAFGRRVAMNAPIQGTAADIIKLAMNRVYDRLHREGLGARLILQVHDELIVETPLPEKEQVALLLKEEMENAFPLSSGLKVDLNMGKSWYDAK
ncbi:MAG: DNA polymerase I [Provencibacterium sp.]|jgi:DNA polymerase-1|nr:DNA polymerase I [Provencibacterium sp.]